MLTVIGILAAIAFALTILSIMNKTPLWIPVLLLTIIELLRIIPKGN
jgi:ABC-type phosphate/phosphonate transport system permease subunit